MTNKEIKEAKSAAHTYAQQCKVKAPGKMMSLAINGSEKVFDHSGAPTGEAGPTNPYPTYLIELQSELPWNGLTPVLDRDHNTCAEAHLWCELKSRGKNPKNYNLISFNADYQVASPCANCAQWVEKAFHEVYKETPAYEHRTRQKP